MKQFITEGPGVPRWASPISHAVVVGDVCYLSGQLSLDADGRYVPGAVVEEADRAFRNLFAAMRVAGFRPDDLVFVDIALVDLANMAEVNRLFSQLFAEGRRPARTVYQVAALPYGGRVKVMGTAAKTEQTRHLSLAPNEDSACAS